MKYFISLSFLLIFVFSCKKSDDLVAERIIGEWQYYSFVINSCPNANNNVPQMFADENGCIDSNCMHISFDNNGKAKFVYGIGEEEEFSYSIEKRSNKITLCDDYGYCEIFHLKDGMLTTEMDEEGCICIFEYANVD